MTNQPVHHAIINTPQLQAQILVWDEGEYSIQKMENTHEDWYYVIGKESINCISSPMDAVRIIFDQNTAQLFSDNLNEKFPPEAVDSTTSS